MSAVTEPVMGLLGLKPEQPKPVDQKALVARAERQEAEKAEKARKDSVRAALESGRLFNATAGSFQTGQGGGRATLG